MLNDIGEYLTAKSRRSMKIAAAARKLDQRGIYKSVEKAEAVAQKLAARYGLTGGNTCGELLDAIRNEMRMSHAPDAAAQPAVRL